MPIKIYPTRVGRGRKVEAAEEGQEGQVPRIQPLQLGQHLWLGILRKEWTTDLALNARNRREIADSSHF